MGEAAAMFPVADLVAPAVLRFHVLGPFETWIAAGPVPAGAWRTRQTLMVLQLLVDQRGRTIGFDRLADLVWPESDPAAARTSLKDAIRTLRRVLEPGVPAARSRHIRTEAGGYRLAAEESWVDADGFLADCQAGAASERRGDADRAVRAYRAAVAAYRGDYLADEPYAEWALERRERLRARCLNALERLASLLEAAGEREEAIGALERALAMDPLREELHRALMRAHSASGRRSHALGAYDRCRRLLAAELGVEPAAETRLLRDALRESDARVAEAPSLLAVELPFVGREAELAALRQAWTRARSAAGHAVVVTAPPGGGKTSLLRHFTERDLPTRTLWLTGHEAEAQMPFATVCEALRGWLAGVRAGGVARLGQYAPVLAHLLPEVLEVWPGCPPAPRRPEASQLFEALTRAARLVLDGPGLIVFDDVHWSDTSSALWLGYSVRTLPAGFLVVVALRDGEQGPAPLTQVLADLRRAARVTDLRLPPLSLDEASRLVGDHELAGRLHTATAGNPFFLVETLRELLRDGHPLSGAPAELPLPASVRELLRSRVGGLDAAARDVLAAVCVRGAPTRAALLAEALGLDLHATLGALDVLLDRRLLCTIPDGRAYLAEHPVVGRAVRDDLSPARRQHWHLRLAAAVQRVEPRRAAEAVRHLLAGGAADADVVEVALRAGEEAFDRHAYPEALECWGAARERLARGADPSRLPALDERIAQASVAVGRWDEAIAGYRALLACAADPLARGRLRRRLALALADQGARGMGQAMEELSLAESELAALSPASETRLELARVLGARSVAQFHRSEFSGAVEASQRALDLLEGMAGVDRDVIDQLIRSGAAEQRLGHLDRAESWFQAAVRRAAAVGDPVLLARCQDSLGLLLQHRGRLDEARELNGAALAAVLEAAVPTVEAIFLGNRGYALDHAGDLLGARRDWEAALRVAEAVDMRHTVVHSRVGLGDVLVRLGELDAARELLESAISLALRIGTVQRHAHGLLYLGEVARLRGDPAGARGLVEEGIALGDRIRDSHVWREGGPLLARALLALGDGRAAVEAAGRGLAVADAGGFLLAQGRCLTALGASLAATGERDRAQAALARSVDLLRRAGAGYLLAEALLAQASVLRGRRRAAALDEATSRARAAGARPLLERAAAARSWR